jgi:hypothetical protein
MKDLETARGIVLAASLGDHETMVRLIAGALRAEREGALEKAAQLVENNIEAIHEGRDGSRRYLTPRRHHNLISLAYAEGIRALKETDQ